MNTISPSPTGEIETSIIVRTFNEARHLSALFDALDSQAYRDFEVIVVDSGSYDSTRDIANERADTLLRIASEDFTFGFSLNFGIAAAKGKYIAIVSAHTVPTGPQWLQTLIGPLRDPRNAMSYGRQVGVASSRFGEVEDFKRAFGMLSRFEDRKHMIVNNANAAIRRDLWLTRQFDDALLGLEDIEWAAHWMERNLRVVYVPDAAIYHIHEESWAQIRRRYYREAVSARLMGVNGRRNIPALIAREVSRLLRDWNAALRPHENPVAERLTLGQRLREIVYFRFHKNLGTIKGLLDTRSAPSRRDRYGLLFDRPAKAVVIHGPGDVRFEDVPVPELKPSDVLVRVAHVAVCATDLEVASGSLGYFKNGMAQFPIVPGHEFSGRIVAMGQNVRDLLIDDSVVVEPIQSCGICPSCKAGNSIACADRAEVGVMRRDGAYSDYVITPARFIHRLPAGFDLRRAALTEPLAVILKGVRRLEQVLGSRDIKSSAVIGAGPLGHLCAKVLAHRGHSVTVFDRNPKRTSLFGESGIATGMSLDRLDDFDCIVEVTGDPDVLDRVLTNSRAGTIFLLLGLPYGEKSFSFEAIAAYDKTITGSVGSSKQDFEDAIRLLPLLDLEPYFACAKPLVQFAEGWKASRNGDVLKVILDVQP